jgi:hypothetical protein
MLSATPNPSIGNQKWRPKVALWSSLCALKPCMPFEPRHERNDPSVILCRCSSEHRDSVWSTILFFVCAPPPRPIGNHTILNAIHTEVEVPFQPTMTTSQGTVPPSEQGRAGAHGSDMRGTGIGGETTGRDDDVETSSMRGRVTTIDRVIDEIRRQSILSSSRPAGGNNRNEEDFDDGTSSWQSYDTSCNLDLQRELREIDEAFAFAHTSAGRRFCSTFWNGGGRASFRDPSHAGAQRVDRRNDGALTGGTGTTMVTFDGAPTIPSSEGGIGHPPAVRFTATAPALFTKIRARGIVGGGGMAKGRRLLVTLSVGCLLTTLLVGVVTLGTALGRNTTTNANANITSTSREWSEQEAASNAFGEGIPLYDQSNATLAPSNGSVDNTADQQAYTSTTASSTRPSRSPTSVPTQDPETAAPTFGPTGSPTANTDVTTPSSISTTLLPTPVPSADSIADVDDDGDDGTDDATSSTSKGKAGHHGPPRRGRRRRFIA